MRMIIYITALYFMIYMVFSPYVQGEEFDKGDIYWLTQNIYHEARGEDLYGQLMVGMVTLERLRDGRWGNTIKEVVTAPSQFSWYSDGKSDIPTDTETWNTSKRVALLSMMLYNTIKDHGIMYYHNQTVKPYWSNNMFEVITIGNHTFYVDKNN